MIYDTRLVPLERLAREEFGGLVADTNIDSQKLRITFNDFNFLDVWLSEGRPDVFAYHWERRHIDGTFYRHDNIPHQKWRQIKSFPKHFHDGGTDSVRASDLPDDLTKALRMFLKEIAARLRP